MGSLALAVLVDPQLLLELGPMERSLSSGNPSVREVALLEVRVFRWLCLLAAAAFAVVFVCWRAVVSSRLVRLIATAPEGRFVADRLQVFNAGLWVMLFVVTASLCFVALGPQLLGAEAVANSTREDRAMEYLTLVFIAVALALAVGVMFSNPADSKQTLVFGGISLVLLVMLGEEISWGQRLLGVDTPAILVSRNVQGETNLHNLFGYLADHVFILGVFLWGFAIPMVWRVSPFWRRALNCTGIPVASSGLAIGFLLASLLQHWLVYRVVARPEGFRIEELRELATFIGLALLMLESWRFRTGQTRTAA